MWTIVGAISIMGLAVFFLLFVTQRKDLRDSSLTAKKGITPGWIIFFAVLVLELGAGYYFCCVLNVYMADSIGRVANAFYVLYIEPAHLASIGFVWLPLPSLLELPLMPLVQLYKPLATSALAGSIVTAFFAAGAALLIYKNCVHFKVPNWATYLMVVLYAFNPFIFLYGSNGMSEAIFIFFIVLTITELFRWIDDEKWMHLLLIGVALALAFLTRYEAIPFAAAVFLALAFFAVKKRRLQCQNEVEINNTEDNNGENGKGNGKSIRSYLEGTAIVVFMPLVTSIVLWILLNWVIMGDPLYFLTSQYSNAVQTAQNMGEDRLALIGNLGGVLIYVAKKSFVFLLPLVAVLLVRFFNKCLFQLETLMFLALALSITAFHYIMLITGGSYGWFRFFVYSLPITLVWLPYEFSKIEMGRVAFKKSAVSFCCLVLAISYILTGIILNEAEITSEENIYITQNASDNEQRK